MPDRTLTGRLLSLQTQGYTHVQVGQETFTLGAFFAEYFDALHALTPDQPGYDDLMAHEAGPWVTEYFLDRDDLRLRYVGVRRPLAETYRVYRERMEE